MGDINVGAAVAWLMLTVDGIAADVNALKAHVERRGADRQAIFNSNKGKRLQYPFQIQGLEDDGLRQKVELLEHFLRVAYQDCTPCDWVCLHSLPGCEEQQPHADFRRAEIEEAAARSSRAYPYACMFACMLCLACMF